MMFLKNKLVEILNGEKAIIFVDMDGVIAYYDLEDPYEFKNRRPLKSNISVLKEISELTNVEMHILSICKKDFQIDDKNNWLDTFASFFSKENRTIISKESFPERKSKELKKDFLDKYIKKHPNVKVVLIDDDNEIIKTVKKEIDGIIVFQDSALVD